MILLDVSVSLRLETPTHIQHGVAKTALSVLQNRGEILAIVPQF